MRIAFAEGADALEGIPLDLMPLLLPYRRYGQLALRIERLPSHARLSHGSNNGDRTWSLTLDDLHGLAYRPPDGMDAAHTLAIRVISLDGDQGATLAVLDFPVPPRNAAPAIAAEPAAAPGPAAQPDEAAELSRLRHELAEVKARLAVREAELTESRQGEQTRGEESRARITAELAAARAGWERELQERLAEAATEAAATLEQSHASWRAAEEARLARSEEDARQRLSEAREHGEDGIRAALAKAEAEWKSDEALRLAAAAAQAREPSERALADATAQLDRARSALAAAQAQAERDQAELRRLRSELSDVQASLAVRTGELAETRRKIEHARAEGSKQAIDAELAAARTAWQAELEARLADAEAAAATTLEQSRAAWLAEQGRRLSALEEAAQERIAEARETWRRDSEAALSKEAEAWKAGETSRLAAAEALWRERSLQAIAEATARYERAETALAEAHARAEGEDSELHRLQGELTDVTARLATREAELIGMRQKIEDARAEGSTRIIEAELAAARARWQAELDQRLAEAAADAATTLDESRGAPDAAPKVPEAAVPRAAYFTDRAQPRSAAEAALDPWPERAADAPRTAMDVGELRQLARVLAARLDERQDADGDAAASLSAPRMTEQPRSRTARRLVAAGALLSALAVTVMVYPDMPSAILDLAGLSRSPLPAAAPQPPLPSPAPGEGMEGRMLVHASVANLRAAPSGRAAVITIIPRQTEVTPLERHGPWVLVRIDGRDGTPRLEGWIYGASLEAAAGR